MLDDLPVPPKDWPQKPAGISLCMIVRDEEDFLGDALASVEGAVDEICIVDTGSTDRTIAIARAAGAEVRELAWEDDFSKARNAALAMATRRWILVLDADEALAAEARPVLAALRERPAQLTGLWIRCNNLTDDYKGTGAMSNAIVRVFPNHERIRYRNVIHEFVALDGDLAGVPAILSGIEIFHRGYLQDVIRQRKKAERNLALAKAALDKEPHDPFHWYNYATSAFIGKDVDEAIFALERMRTLNAGRSQGFMPAALGMLADLYLNERQNSLRAEVIAREALERAPTFANAHFTLGKALAAQQRFAEAREAFVSAIDDGKHTHEHFYVDDEVPRWKAHSEIGGTLMEEGGFELALAWFDFALQVRPKLQPVRLNRARALEQLGRFEEAESVLKEVWEDDRDAFAANEYLNYLLRRGRDADALAFIGGVAEGLPPDTQVILYGSAATLAARGSEGLDQAERYLEQALAVRGVLHHRERLTALFKHFGSPLMLALLERGSPTL